MSEIEALLATIRAAKAANLASLNALSAVEQMLGNPNTPVLEKTDAVQDLGICEHKGASGVTTMGGSYLLCSECGEQIPA